MKKRLLLSIVLAAGCQTMSGIPAGNPCPFVFDEGFGYTLTLPCDATDVVLDTFTPGLVQEKLFRDPNNNLFSLEVAPPEGAGIDLGGESNARFDGLFETGFGDTMVLVTLRLDVATFFRAFGILANGNLLRVTTFSSTRSRAEDLLFFSTINMHNTDGSAVKSFAQDDASNLLAPFFDRYILLEDKTVWGIHGSDKLKALSWKSGDLVFVLAADRFNADAFITKIPDWISLKSDYVGLATLHQVADVRTDAFCTDVELSDGSVWTCAESLFANSLVIGETVAVFEDVFSEQILQLSTGKSASFF